MLHEIAIWFIAAMTIVTYALELWTGCAVAGWKGDNTIITREQSPGPYWFVMIAQTILLASILIIWFI